MEKGYSLPIREARTMKDEWASYHLSLKEFGQWRMLKSLL
jgi:hypothetical protein